MANGKMENGITSTILRALALDSALDLEAGAGWETEELKSCDVAGWISFIDFRRQRGWLWLRRGKAKGKGGIEEWIEIDEKGGNWGYK